MEPLNCSECDGTRIDASHDAARYYADRGELSPCPSCDGTGQRMEPLNNPPMERKPITRQRSPWELFERGEIMGYPNEWHQRRVHDGLLVACVGEEPTGWHLSISHRSHQGPLRRYPTWDEIAHARDEFLPSDVGFVMHLPPSDQYVALHDTTFHLHEHPERGDE